MGRPVVLSNGSLFVGLSESGLVHDFYYPYVGLDNLTTARSVNHKIGVWVDNQFSWVDDGSWQVTVNFEEDVLASKIMMRNEKLQLELRTTDFVDSQLNAFCRRIVLVNLSDRTRDVRLFMHQVFEISRSGRADTALYVPDGSYILDYKGRVSLLVYGETEAGQPFDQYAVGNYGIEGKEGTFKDAEDGELGGNAVEHGGVDSVMRFHLQLAPNEPQSVNYWIVAASSQYDAEKHHRVLRIDGLTKRYTETWQSWHAWLGVAADGLHQVPKEYLDMTKKSLMIIKAHIDRRGAILASGDSSIFNYGRDYYCYCWPRDGAYAIWPLIRLGYKDEPRAFFEFCRDVLSEGGYLEHKYQPDRAIGSTWHPLLHANRQELAIQEDETAGVLYMLHEYYQKTKDEDFVRNLYGTFIQPAANFMMSYIDDETGLPHASYDLWEEKFLTTTYTTFITQAALEAAANMAETFDFPDDAAAWREAAKSIGEHTNLLFDEVQQAYRKGFYLQPDGEIRYDNTIDASSGYSALMYANHQTEMAHLVATMNKYELELLDKSPSGGMPRYSQDYYMKTKHQYTGNPWFICTLWLAQFNLRRGKRDEALAQLKWCMDRAMLSGVLSEQIDPETSAPVGVAPLVWSHAELVNTILDVAA